jgi:hypothetical protein
MKNMTILKQKKPPASLSGWHHDAIGLSQSVVFWRRSWPLGLGTFALATLLLGFGRKVAFRAPATGWRAVKSTWRWATRATTTLSTTFRATRATRATTALPTEWCRPVEQLKLILFQNLLNLSLHFGFQILDFLFLVSG